MLSLDQRITQVAAQSPGRGAITAFDVRTGTSRLLTWRELDERTARRAVAAGPPIAEPVWLPGACSIDGVVDLIALLRAGFIAAPLDATAPPADRERQLAAIAAACGGVTSLAGLADRDEPADRADVTGRLAAGAGGGTLLLTGGTTGRPKVVRSPAPRWNADSAGPLLLQYAGWRPGQTQLVLGPLHHAAPFSAFLTGVLGGCHTIVANGYYPELVFEVAEQQAIEWIQLTPVHMRMAEPLLDKQKLAGVRAVLHTAAPCPAATKRAWIEALGPDRVFEMYAATEGIGTTLCSGAEWLARPGTVGRGFMTRISVVDAAGVPVPAGVVGEIRMRSVQRSAGRAEGFRSVGDHGWVDADGYLFLQGRRDDMVIVGGENVYLSQVEAALLAHEAIADALVVAADDEVYGVRLDAYVVARPGRDLSEPALLRHCRDRLPPYQLPRTWAVVTDLPRNAAGKLLRHAHTIPTREAQE